MPSKSCCTSQNWCFFLRSRPRSRLKSLRCSPGHPGDGLASATKKAEARSPGSSQFRPRGCIQPGLAWRAPVPGSEAHFTRGETEAQGVAGPHQPLAQAAGRTTRRPGAGTPRAAPNRPGPTYRRAGRSSPPRAATPALPPQSPSGPAARVTATAPGIPASATAPCWRSRCHLNQCLRGRPHSSAGPRTHVRAGPGRWDALSGGAWQSAGKRSLVVTAP
ncbi:hypothetical protein P7K49_004203 [Saguinus oedipus]|uniref:Uncharacterized protein n=1 Tax=Saguinus oedipus TaxID=9490 RepID=A0ABQ9W6P6_SAGOE|nr:hypothetical protein P7K49_004203 [Saguinus oedipus]